MKILCFSYSIKIHVFFKRTLQCLSLSFSLSINIDIYILSLWVTSCINVLCFVSWILMSYCSWQQEALLYMSDSSSAVRGQKENFHFCSQPFATTAAGSAEITQELEPKTRRLFICRFSSRRNDMHSEATLPSVFLNVVVPLSVPFSFFLFVWGSAGVALSVASHRITLCAVCCLVPFKCEALEGD